MKRLSKPLLTMETIKNMEDMSFFTHCQIFDDLIIVAQKETACYVLNTLEGLVIIDGIWPAREAYDAILDGIRDAGWNENNISKLILTHGHVDHTGCGRWIVEEFQPKTYMSRVDDEFWAEHPTKPDRPDTWKDFLITDYIVDGDIIDCGNVEIKVVGTPGHTPGCMSYIFPVTENGEKHMAAIFGGATPPWNNKAGTLDFLGSLDHFIQRSKEEGVDVGLNNHTAFDNGLERIEYSRKRFDYMPNIYIMGQKGFQRYCRIFRTLGEEALL